MGYLLVREGLLPQAPQPQQHQPIQCLEVLEVVAATVLLQLRQHLDPAGQAL
jgi:hypothetical protein